MGELQWEIERELVLTVRRGGESSTSEVLPSQGRFAALGGHVMQQPETRRPPLACSLKNFSVLYYNHCLCHGVEKIVILSLYYRLYLWPTIRNNAYGLVYP